MLTDGEHGKTYVVIVSIVSMLTLAFSSKHHCAVKSDRAAFLFLWLLLKCEATHSLQSTKQVIQNYSSAETCRTTQSILCIVVLHWLLGTAFTGYLWLNLIVLHAHGNWSDRGKWGQGNGESQIGSRETDTQRNRKTVGVSRQAISFLFVSAGAGLVSPADQTPFPLIKSFEIFHLSVSRPRRVAVASSQPCLLTVSFSNLYQTLTTSSCP